MQSFQKSCWQNGTDCYQKYHSYVLHSQKRWHPLSQSPLLISRPLGVVPNTSYLSQGFTYCWSRQQPGRPQPHEFSSSQMELDQSIFLCVCKRWSKPTSNLFASCVNWKCKRYCSRASIGKHSQGHAFIDRWPKILTYLFLPFPLLVNVVVRLQQDKPNAIVLAPWWPRQPWFPVLHNLSSDIHHLPCLPHLFTQNNAQVLHPVLTCSAPGSMENPALLMNILRQSKKPSTIKAYLFKWNRFKSFTEASSLPSVNPSLATVLCFLLHLKSSGLSLSSLIVYLSTIVSYQPPNSPAAD